MNGEKISRTVREYLIRKVKKDYDHVNDEKAEILADLWLSKNLILGADDSFFDLPYFLQMRISMHFSRFVLEHYEPVSASPF